MKKSRKGNLPGGSFGRKTVDMWMACYTQDEIAAMVGVSKMEVSRTCNESAILPESYKPAANHLTDFELPIAEIFSSFGRENDFSGFKIRALTELKTWKNPCSHGVSSKHGFLTKKSPLEHGKYARKPGTIAKSIFQGENRLYALG